MYTQLKELQRLLAKYHLFMDYMPNLERMVLDSWKMCKSHGDFKAWHRAYTQLPEGIAAQCDFSVDTITLTKERPLDDTEQQHIIDVLMGLYPWRKGPFNLFGILLDCEWRSDMKWNRLKDHVSSLKDRFVLDVGCGSGYHCWRMHGAGAKVVIGIDPGLLFVLQFMAIKHFTGKQPVFVLPQTLDSFPKKTEAFDTVFSMGVLYHRRSPLGHIVQLRDCLRRGGELVLETLVVEGDEFHCLMPEKRYSCMPNVWFLPSSAMLKVWLMRCGFKDVRLIHESYTTLAEQRPTTWTWNHSLKNFLDPNNSKKTLEGYPAPRRAILIATKR